MTCTSTSSPRRRISWIGGLNRGRRRSGGWRPLRLVLDSFLRTRRPRPIRCRVAAAARFGRPQRPAGVIAALAEVLRSTSLTCRSRCAHAEIDERRLDARLQVDHDSLVNVSYVIVLSGPFDIQFFEDPSSTIAIRHSSGCATLISISCFML